MLSQTQIHKTRTVTKQVVGSRLKQVRLAAGLTQKALAKRLNIGVSTLSVIENGQHVMTHPQDYYVRLICQTLNVDVHSVMAERTHS